MKTRVADLIVEVPEAGDLLPRCMEYRCDQKENADIILCSDGFHLDNWKSLSEKDAVYMESGFHFYGNLLKYDGIMLHASAVELDGKGYLFSGNCGAGKSTHTRLWQTVYGEKAHIFNDDKPALRLIDDVWYAYGTPWCGKDAININMKVPLAGICFMKQARENRIRRLSQREAVQKIIRQTMYRLHYLENLDLMLSHVDKLVRMIPIFELENKPEPAAAYLSYETMCRAAEELGL